MEDKKKKGMLLLDRGIGQSVMISDDIEVKVTSITYVDQQLVVRLGIDAPRKIPVDRKEVRDRKLGGRTFVAGGQSLDTK